VQWFEAYEAARQHNRAIVGAASQSVGAAGGWLSGGGHSAIAPNYGLGTPSSLVRTKPYSPDRFVGVDNVLEITIVTADGSHVIANPYRNEDLFWALRGGGGGTWGVVTSVTYKTHPPMPLSSALLVASSTNVNSTQNLLAEIIRLTPSLIEQGYGGYGNGSTEHIQLLVLSPNVTAEETQATFLPLFEFAASQPGISVENSTAVHQDFWSWYESTFSTTSDQVGVPSEVSSWLLPKDTIQTDKPGELAAELLKMSGFAYL
jgi:FAD/FMN-containing dehydrogenase